MTINPLLTAFDIGEQPELIAIVGGGGKTSLMFALANALPGRVVITTTTRIFAAQMKLAPAVCTTSDLTLLTTHLAQHGACLVIGEVQGDKALGIDPSLPGQLLAHPDVDYVIVEADGSRMRPIKAPAAHEPVIPPEATLVIPVAGIDALDGPLDKVAHRPELVRAVISKQYSVASNVAQRPPRVQFSDAESRLSVEDIAALLVHPEGGLKGVPERARVIPLINKVETAGQLTLARQIAHHALRHSPLAPPHSPLATPHAPLATPHAPLATPPSPLPTPHSPLPTRHSPPHIVIGAIRTPQPICEVQRRVTAVILAAGEAKRMGQMKQLLPWGDTTVLGQTIRQTKQSLVHEVWAVSGHRPEEVEAIADQEDIYVLRNPQYASGEMLSSLQTAVAQFPPHTAAVLVMLTDQPMVEPETINQLLIAFWQGKGQLIAPAYKDKRGNPVLIGRSHFPQLLALPVGDAPRTLLQKHPVYIVPVTSDSILRDLDRPEDYERERPS